MIWKATLLVLSIAVAVGGIALISIPVAMILAGFAGTVVAGLLLINVEDDNDSSDPVLKQ